MNYLLVAFMVFLVLPLLMGSWRVSLVGLAAQGVILFWLTVEHGWHVDASTFIHVADIALFRTVLVPRALWKTMHRRGVPPRNDVIPPNLLSWTLAAMLVVLSFRFAQRFHPDDVTASAHLAVSTSAVLLGLFVLASGDGIFSQVVGLMRLENGILLFEMSSQHSLPVGVQVGVSLAYAGTAFFAVHFLGHEGHVGTPRATS